MWVGAMMIGSLLLVTLLISFSVPQKPERSLKIEIELERNGYESSGFNWDDVEN